MIYERRKIGKEKENSTYHCAIRYSNVTGVARVWPIFSGPLAHFLWPIFAHCQFATASIHLYLPIKSHLLSPPLHSNPSSITMSFKFPSLQSIQDTISNYDFEQLTKTTGKTYQEISKSIQPFTHKTTELIGNQLNQIQQFANQQQQNVEVSELPKDYLELEANCDMLLKLYTNLIQFTNDTFDKVSYDYPPANGSLSKLNGRFNQLKNVTSPQELESLLLGKPTNGNGASEVGTEEEDKDTVNVQVINVPKTLYGQLSKICDDYQNELKDKENPLNFALLQISETYLQIANERLTMDKKIMKELNQSLVEILNKEFISVNELRKKVYSTRHEFDLIRSKVADDEENDELIKKEDELVSATESAVIEMKNLIKPSKSVNLLKVFVEAQKEWFEVSAKQLATLSASLDKLDVKD